MSTLLQTPTTTQTTIRVSALHALAYCPRLFYLEEVEELYTQDAAVFAGRRLHAELKKQEDEDWEDLSYRWVREAIGLPPQSYSIWRRGTWTSRVRRVWLNSTETNSFSHVKVDLYQLG